MTFLTAKQFWTVTASDLANTHAEITITVHAQDINTSINITPCMPDNETCDVYVANQHMNTVLHEIPYQDALNIVRAAITSSDKPTPRK